MQNTRRQILEFLQTNAPVSARAINLAVGMTLANIRHHLQKLMDDGFVEVVEKSTIKGRGRPTLFYGLTSRGLKKDYRQLTVALWMELLSGYPEDEYRDQLKKLARRIIASEASAGGNLTQRLYQTVRQLRGLDFNARWEAHAQSPIIILEQCPFAALRPDLPDICSLDGEIISHLVGHPVEQIAIGNNPSGGRSHCTFRVSTF